MVISGCLVSDGLLEGRWGVLMVCVGVGIGNRGWICELIGAKVMVGAGDVVHDLNFLIIIFFIVVG
jgi:hypothetical protein